ncbi:uncharacterized protein LOC100908859 [Galendromus occidentalis]|uniref:Uncharacterized protein LOC100908859 n=1 Tax=Galendromus occidentalis TaxID=34638 RepID=A0AAJ6VVC3_9ACAR|nr:uncharacterized protein LOC100908859 [Galendromus occidentalis]
MDSKPNHPPENNPATPFWAFGRVEELEVFARQKDQIIGRPFPKDTCPHCGIYSGTAEALEEHQRSHEASGRPYSRDFDRECAEMSEIFEKVEREVEQVKEMGKIHQSWRNFVFDFYRRIEKAIPEEELTDLKISVKIGGKYVDAEELNQRLRQRPPGLHHTGIETCGSPFSKPW